MMSMEILDIDTFYDTSLPEMATESSRVEFESSIEQGLPARNSKIRSNNGLRKTRTRNVRLEEQCQESVTLTKLARDPQTVRHLMNNNN